MASLRRGGRLRGRAHPGRLSLRHRGRPAGRPRQAAGRSPGAGRSVAGLPRGHEPGRPAGRGLSLPEPAVPTIDGSAPAPARACCRPSISVPVRRRNPPARAARRPRAAGDAAVGRDARSRTARAGPIPAPGRDRPGRHGRDPQGSRRRSGARAGDQGAAGVAPGRSRGRAPIRRGGADRRPVAAPGGRAGLRAGDVPRPPSLFRHEAGQGPDPGRACSTNGTGPGAGPAPVPVRSSSRSARRWPMPTRGA